MHVSQIHSSNSLLLFVFLQRGKVVETKVVPCGRSGLTSKSDIFHTNMQINGPKSVHMQNYGRATITKILNYTGSRGVKLSQKVFFWGGLLFWLTLYSTHSGSDHGGCSVSIDSTDNTSDEVEESEDAIVTQLLHSDTQHDYSTRETIDADHV